MVAGSRDAVMMVEAGANELPEEVILESILFGHEEIKKLVAFQDEVTAACGKEKKEYTLFKVDETLEKAVRDFATEKINTAYAGIVKNREKQPDNEYNADTNANNNILDKERKA